MASDQNDGTQEYGHRGDLRLMLLGGVLLLGVIALVVLFAASR